MLKHFFCGQNRKNVEWKPKNIRFYVLQQKETEHSGEKDNICCKKIHLGKKIIFY